MIKTILVLEKFSPDGKLLDKREQESRSWLKHFFDLFYTLTSQTLLAGINDVSAAPRTLSIGMDSTEPFGHLQIASPAGGMGWCIPTYSGTPGIWTYITHQKGDDFGIVVGTGNLAVTPIQDALQTKVAHGEAAGQLLYGGVELYGLTFADPNGQFTIRRYFTNVLGGVISIQEVGIYGAGIRSLASDQYSYAFCIARDVVAPAVDVNNGEILRVTYVPQITV
jgi:hypothetical protein